MARITGVRSNSAILSRDRAARSVVEGIANQALIATGSNGDGRRYTLGGKDCYILLEWANDRNLALAVYLPEEEQYGISEEVQRELKRQLEAIVIAQSDKNLAVGVEILQEKIFK